MNHLTKLRQAIIVDQQMERLHRTLSYVDAHIHLADPSYKGQIDSILEDATRNGIKHLLSNSVDYETSIQTIALAKQHPGFVLAAIGLHPSTVAKAGNANRHKIWQLLDEHGEHVSAIGEIGLDGKYTQDQEKMRLEKETFRFFLNIAEKKRLPVVIHSRFAVSEVLVELSRFNLPRVLLHWYDGPTENLKLIQDRGWMISTGPALLYSDRIARIALAADLNMILSETDGPVHHRGPFEGSTTKPSFVIDVIKKLSQLKSKKVEDVREEIDKNFRRLTGT